MGAEQSSHRRPGTSSSTAAPQKTDYYELLAVDQQATEEEIKKAYRRKALELHPDRNFGDVERATTLFAEVQAAYDVLSDPQERAWYDTHAASILCGNDPDDDGERDGDGIAQAAPRFRGVRVSTVDDLYRIFAKFSPQMAFTDQPDGFFGLARATFVDLADQEAAFAQYDGRPEKAFDYPPFGSAGDAFEPIPKRFYATWNGFATIKSFAWKDRWKLSEAPDRRTRRLMEKENKTARDDARREFNDSVRALVAFIRKRDPRAEKVKRLDKEREETMREAAKAQAKRSRLENERKAAAEYVVPDWARSRDSDAEEGQEGEFEESEEEEDIEVLECVVCDKIFQTDGMYEEHAKSKKHLKKTQKLKWEMRKQNQDIVGYGGEDDQGEPDDTTLRTKSTLADFKPVVSDENEGGQGGETEEDKDQEINQNGIKEDGEEDEGEEEADEEENEDEDYAPRSVIESRLNLSATEKNKNSPSTQNIPNQKDHDLGGDDQDDNSDLATQLDDKLSLADTTSDTPAPAKKMGKAKAKRERKATKQKQTAAENEGSENRCAVCREPFDSKTKLFNHIKSKGHAAPISAIGSSGANESSQEKNKNKKKR